MLYYNEDLLPDPHFIAITAYPEANSTQQLSFDKLVFTEIGINSRRATLGLASPADLTMRS